MRRACDQLFIPPLDGEGGAERSEAPGGVIGKPVTYPHPGSPRFRGGSPTLPAGGRDK